MKKILTALFLFLLIFINKIDSVNADCRPWVPSQCAQVRCDINGQWNCCDTSSQCTAANGTPMDNNPSDQEVTDPTANCGGTAIDTAIGCIPVGTTTGLGGWILGWAVGIGGGIAFLLITYASFMVMTSAGDPQRLKAGQELLTSAISGVIMLVFSVFILRFIGIDILRIDTL